MPKNLLNDEELKQLVSGSEYLSGAFPDTRCPRYHRSRRASPPAGRLEGSRTRASFTPLKEVVRPFSDASRSRAERAGPARRVPEHPIRTECARTRAYNAPRASLGATLVPHRTRS